MKINLRNEFEKNIFWNGLKFDFRKLFVFGECKNYTSKTRNLNRIFLKWLKNEFQKLFVIGYGKNYEFWDQKFGWEVSEVV
jgi:hypothetical protein